MANKGIAAFKEFTAGVLAKISDPDQRRKAEESIASLEAIQPVAQAFGDGVAGQAEIDRQLQELATQRQDLDTRKTEIDARERIVEAWHGELTEWYGANKARLEARPAPQPVADPAKAAVVGITEEQLAERLRAHEAGVLGFARDQNVLTRDHYAKFGEILELEPLLRHPQIATLGLTGVYELVHKDRLTQHKAQEDQKREETIRADERAKVLQSQAQMPYPTPTGAGSGSPLDSLTPNKEPVVDAAVAHYNRLQAEKVGAAR